MPEVTLSRGRENVRPESRDTNPASEPAPVAFLSRPLRLIVTLFTKHYIFYQPVFLRIRNEYDLHVKCRRQTHQNLPNFTELYPKKCQL